MVNASRKSLEPSVFRLKDNGQDVLIGSQCQKCKRVFFPQREWCASCLEPTCKEIELSREGKLLSFSLVERQQNYSLVTAPYLFGEILIPEGPHIYTTLNLKTEQTDKGPKAVSTVNEQNLNTVKIGQKVVLSPVAVKKDEDGSEVVAYNFQTVEK
ncbi:MAG: hypothetical protein HYX96_01845 [Chloroflexi bacterium]|nr:hypothetical protein [Chloroflexota bacterium]